MKFNYDNIYFNPKIKTEDAKVKNMFNQLFDRFLNDLNTKTTESSIYKDFIDDFKFGDYLKNTPNERIVVDFIAGMTDDYFHDQYQDIFLPKNYGYSLK